MRRSARLQGKPAPSSASITGKSTKFTDLPMELHLLIFKELVNSYTIGKGETLKSDSAKFREEILPLSLLNSVWRIIVHETAFSVISLRADELEDFIDTAKDNLNLLGYIKELTITSAAGDSMDREALLRREEIAKKKALEAPNTVYYKDKSAILIENGFTMAERAEIFEEMWINLVKLFDMVPQHLLKITSLTITCNDILKGLYNRQRLPQVSLIPRRDGARIAKSLRPLPKVVLKKLELEPQILDHLELDPQIIKTIIRSNPSITTLNLRISDIRGFRILRRDIYDGLTNIIRDLNSRQTNLTILVVKYPSSFSRHQSSWDRVFALADFQNDNDPLSNALRVLSKELVSFHFQGRISKHLFLTNNTKEKSTWPRLKRFVVNFELIDSFGKALIKESNDYHPWYDGDTWCETCGCASVPECFEPFECMEANPVAHEAWGRETTAQQEEGIDDLLCETCRTNLYDEPDLGVAADAVNELFAAASAAMLQMPKISVFVFKSTDDHVYFCFQQSKMIGCIAKWWWEPNKTATSIWKGRFSELRFKKKKLSAYMLDFVADMMPELVFGLGRRAILLNENTDS